MKFRYNIVTCPGYGVNSLNATNLNNLNGLILNYQAPGPSNGLILNYFCCGDHCVDHGWANGLILNYFY